MELTREQVDVVVLGLGPGGEYAARKLAEAGLDVVGVDKALIGGECPFWGCVPSKLMVRAADVLAEARRGARLAGTIEVEPDWSRVAQRIRRANHDWTDDSHVEPLERSGVRILRGRGRLAGEGRVDVQNEDGTTGFEATRAVVLNTGTDPARPDIEGLDGTPYWTNREAMKVTEVPHRLLVLGGGPNGVELAQAFARFGAGVTLLDSSDRIMDGEEPDASEVLSEVFAAEGIEVRTGVDVERVEHDGVFRVSVAGETLEADQLLSVVGRRTNLADIGLETVGLDPDADSLGVDERLRAGPRLYAVGDITGKGAFTHVSRYQAAIVVRHLLGVEGHPADYRGLSRVTFTDPEIGSVGLTEAAARELGLDVRTGHADLAKASRGWIHGRETAGLVKLVADAKRGVLVGGTVVAPYGGEVIGLIAAAVHAEIPLTTLRSMHFAYPTFHRAIEAALNELGESL